MTNFNHMIHDHVVETNFSPLVPLVPPFFPLPLPNNPHFNDDRWALMEGFDIRGWSCLHTSPAPTVCFYFPPLFYYFTNCFILLDYVYELQCHLHCCNAQAATSHALPLHQWRWTGLNGGDQHKGLETSASPATTVHFLFIFYFTTLLIILFY